MGSESDEKETALARLSPIRPDLYSVSHTIADMTTTAANAAVEVARETHGVPARQETVRTGVVAGCIVALAAAGVAVVPQNQRADVFIVAIITLGSAWGISSAIEKWRKK